MKQPKAKDKSVQVKKTYECPKISFILVELEQGIAAASVQGTGMQQEHNEESQRFDIEW